MNDLVSSVLKTERVHDKILLAQCVAMEKKNRNHIVRYHCTQCIRFDSCDYFEYTEHLRSFHIESNDNFHCKCCNLYFELLIHFVTHMYRIHMYRSFDCICGLEYDSVPSLENHIKRCTNLDKELCTSCKRTVCYCRF